jgi:hypothetical protein
MHPWHGGTEVRVSGVGNDQVTSTHIFLPLVDWGDSEPDIGVSERMESCQNCG